MQQLIAEMTSQVVLSDRALRRLSVAFICIAPMQQPAKLIR